MIPAVSLWTLCLGGTDVHQTLLKTIVWQWCPALGLLKLCFGEQVFTKKYWKLMFGNKVTHWAYKNCAWENRCSPNSIGQYCLTMIPLIGLIKIVLWRTGVRQTILNYSLDMMPRIGLMKIVFLGRGPNSIESHCLRMIPRIGHMRIVLWRTGVP